MISLNSVIFYGSGALFFIFLLRPIIIDIKARKYVCKHHKDYYNDNISLFWGSDKSGGNNIYVYSKHINDPVIDTYISNWNKSVRQLIIIILALVICLIAYVVYSQKIRN